MDISPAGPGIAPWLVVAIRPVLLALGAVAVLRRGAARRSAVDEDAVPPQGLVQDDLPGFLESPPGTAGRAVPPSDGWPSLAPSPAAPPPEAPARSPHRSRAVVVGALALTALLVVAAAVVLGPDRRGPGRGEPHDRRAAELAAPPSAPAPGDPGAGELAEIDVRPGRDGGAGRLEFGGLVLEQRAVGVTVTYPAVEVSWDGRQAVAHLRLPTFNCLSAAAPEDPAAASCVAAGTEYADLPSPALALTGDDGRVRLSGRFPTYVRPNGSPPVWTGRVYEIEVRAAPADSGPAEGWVRAEGELRLGSGRAPTLDTPDVTVLRPG